MQTFKKIKKFNKKGVAIPFQSAIIDSVKGMELQPTK